MLKWPAAAVDKRSMPSVLTRARTAVCLGTLAALAIPAAAWAHDPEPPRVKVPSTATSGLAATLAKLSAIVDPRDLATTVHFEIGRTQGYGYSTTEKSIPYSSSVQVWVSIYGLSPFTRYHFRAVATNRAGTTAGPDQTFMTLLGTGAPGEAITDVAPGTTGAASPLDASIGGDPASPTVPASTTPDPLPGSETAVGAPTGTGDGSGTTGAVPVLLPEQSKSVVVEELSGAINWRPPGAKEFQGMTGVGAIPVGAIVDARRGTVGLSADAGTSIDSGRFWGAVFEVRQEPEGGGVTELALRGGRPRRCSRGDATGRSAAKRPPKGLWGKDHGGHFRTRGRNSVAAVRGTLWYVAERCAGTLTRVLQGAVEVRDVHRHTTVLVKAGHHLMVRDR